MIRGFKGRHIVAIDDFTKDELIHVLDVARELEKKKRPHLLDENVVATLFFEPSTRTRLSFESAAHRLGAQVLGFADPEVTSATKGETLHDTIKMVENYADVIVMRHPTAGAATEAAAVSAVPVINAGDGPHEHPTQTLVDLYTIKKSQGKISGLKIAMVGDLKYGRTVHSLARALSHFDCELFFVAPASLKMPDDVKKMLDAKDVAYHEVTDLAKVLPRVDILYMTRVQKERFSSVRDYEKVKNSYILTAAMLKGVKQNLRVMHPLPRVNEISMDVDETPYALYFEQAGNAVPVREALLALVLGKME